MLHRVQSLEKTGIPQQNTGFVLFESHYGNAAFTFTEGAEAEGFDELVFQMEFFPLIGTSL